MALIRYIKRIFGTWFQKTIRQELHRFFLENIPQKSIEQINLLAVMSNSKTKLSFNDAGFRVHSQNEEDGLILFIFSLISTTNKKCVEICCGNALECNTTNLIIHHGWTGLMFDGSVENITMAKQFFSNIPDTKYWPPKIVNQWITAENVNELIESQGFSGEIDLLSIDIDGIDYWLWESISVIKPRVVVTEINHLWGPEESVTVPYDPQFKAVFTEHGSDYAGASLKAFVKLGKKKGYKLIGTNRFATNAFFVRNDLISERLPEMQPKDCFHHNRAQFGIKERLPNIKNMKWQRID